MADRVCNDCGRHNDSHSADCAFLARYLKSVGARLKRDEREAAPKVGASK